MPVKSLPVPVAAAECAHCSGPLGGDPRADPVTGQRFCCYGCRVLGARPGQTGPTDSTPSPTAGLPWFRVGVGALIASQAMVLSLAANLAQPTGPVRWTLHAGLAGSALFALGWLGLPLVRQACACLRDRRVAVEWLFLAGVVGAFGASLYSTFTGRGALYYEVVAVLLTVYAAGKALTATTREKAFRETRHLRDLFARARRRMPSGDWEWVPVAGLEIGDQVRVDPGEPVTVDGRVTQGEAWVRETPLTGEPLPVVRRPGDPVFAGSFSEDGTLELEVTRPGRSRRLDGVLTAVETARGSLADSVAQRDADRVAALFLPLVLGVAALTAGYWVWRGDPGAAWFNALSVLLVACPCALGLATPLALWHALAALAARGIVVRSAAALERAATLTEVCFDKTGTLTEAAPELADFVTPGDSVGRQQLLAWAAAVQARSSHPLAYAFHSGTTAAAGTGPEVRGFRLVPACGVEAWLLTAAGSEHRIRLGSTEWLLPGPRPAWTTALRARAGDALVALEVDGQLAGLAAVREATRPGVAAVLNELRTLGCRVTVLSGDREDRVQELMAGLGDLTAEAGLTPAGKEEAVQRRRRAGQVVGVVGDGVNDAAAMQAAAVGIAIGGAAPLAEAAADVVLAGGDLSGLPTVIRVARETRSAIRSSLAFAAFYNALGMGLAAVGWLHPVAAALLMVGSSAVVAWRALRPSTDPCAQPDPTPLAKRAAWRAAGGWVWATTFALQIPWVLGLGQLTGVQAWTAGLSLAVLAGLSGWPGLRRWPVVRASLAMLGPGNLLMLVGWWIDAGGGPVMRDGVCLCCRAHHYFEVGARIPWMYVGMLVGGLPPMWPALRTLGRGRSRGGVLALAALVSVGMLLGMGWGAEGVLRWAGPGHPWQFLLALAGMSAGMLIGMTFAAALAEATRAGCGFHRACGVGGAVRRV